MIQFSEQHRNALPLIRRKHNPFGYILLNRDYNRSRKRIRKEHKLNVPLSKDLNTKSAV